MPVSAELLKALADDPKALEQQLGCMTGLFQIFDRQGVGRRYGSKRVSNAASGQSQPTSACETPRHDHRSSNPYWMFEDDASQRMARNGDKEQHHRAYSDSSEIFLTKASIEAATTESSAKSPLFSEDELAAPFYHNDSDEHCHLQQQQQKKLSVVVPSRATTGSDIRDIVRASFDQHRKAENPRLSVDGHGYNLPRSSSVDHGRDRLRDVSASVPRHQPVDLPRSSSVGGRGAARMLADWKDGLRSPRLSKQNVAELARKHQNSGEGVRDVAELTRKHQNPSEGGRVVAELVKKHQNSGEGGRDVADVIRKHQNSSEGGRDVAELLRKHQNSGEGRRDVAELLRKHQNSGEGGRDVAELARKHQNSGETRFTVELLQGPRLSVCVDDRRGKASNFSRPCEATEFKESLRAAEIKELLRGSQRVGHRYSVDGTRDAPRACTAPRLSVDGREYSAPRRLKMEGNGEFVRQSSERENRRKAPNVVARLMGLDELPKETDPLQEFLGESPPPPSPPEDYDYARRTEVLQHWQEDSRFPSTHQEVQQFEELAKKGVEEHVVEERRLDLKVEVPRRRSLWHIFEAMHLKGWSSKKKQAEALRLRNLEKEEKEREEVKKRSQSLPPRLSASQDYQDTPRVLTLPLNRDSRAVPEHKPGSGHEHYYRQADEEPCVVVGPTMTRSMSYKSQPTAAAAAPVQTPVAQVEDITSPRYTNRGVSENVAYHRETQAYHRESESFLRETTPKEPLQGADSSSCSHEMSSSARQSRKERGAPRMTKSFCDAPQSERDSSPRGPRAHTHEKPSRSRGDSSSVSPRCPGSVEGMRLMEAAKMRRKQAIAVKDREETKASLANLRANATKQEFLKGRASGDPDTPRLLRRSSSESKLLAKIAEKPVIADTPKPPVGGRSAAAPNMTLVRSKRPVSKDNKSPLKTRPTSTTPSVKSVPKPSSPKAATVTAEHVHRPKMISTDVSEPASTVPQEPAESKRAQSGEVRPTQGGALDHSGDTFHSNAREQRTESKAREKTIEIDEGVKTPRGVSIKKIVFSEDAQAEVAEQPSPVSVLDNSHFDEELTPSPKAAKSSVVCLQEQSRIEKDRRWSSARFLDLDLEENTTPSLSVKEASPDLTTPVHDPPHQHTICVCLKDADEERAYVEELMGASNGWNSSDTLDLSSDYVIDPSVFDQLEANRTHLDDEKEALDRRILFDCVNEVLERLLLASKTGTTLRKRPVGLKEVLIELESIPCTPSEDVCDTVYVILQKDLLKGRGQQWSDYRTELEEVGVAVERMIVKDLIEETVRELLGQTPGNASRRQLFA